MAAAPTATNAEAVALTWARRSTVALVANSALNAVLGLGFWTLAARNYSAITVGTSASAVSLLLFLANISDLNLCSVVARFLPGAGTRGRSLVVRSYAAGATLAAAVAVVVFSLAYHRLPALEQIHDLGAIGLLWFVAAVAVWTIFAMQDAVAVALRGARLVPLENAAFGVLKIVLLVVFSSAAPTFGILLAWTIPMAAMLLPMNVAIFRVLLPNEALTGTHSARRVSARTIGSFMTAEYLTALCQTAVVTFVPIVIAARRSGTEVAHFYLIWVIGSAIEAALNAIGSALVTEAARQPELLGRLVRDLLWRACLIGVPAVAAGAALAGPGLRLLGDGYAEAGAGLLRLLLLSSLFRVLIIVWMSIHRIRHQTVRVFATQGAITVALIASALLISRSDLSLGTFGVAMASVYALVAILASADLRSTMRAVRERVPHPVAVGHV